jgi:hypothetical protein
MTVAAFVKRFLRFTAYAFLLYALLVALLGDRLPDWFFPNLRRLHGGSGYLATKTAELRNTGPVDILFIGSSHAYRGFDVRTFRANGYSCYNLGTSGQTPIQTGVLLKRYLPVLAPRLVVLEVYPQTFCLDGVESGLDLVNNGEWDKPLIPMAVTAKNVKIVNSFLYWWPRKVLSVAARADTVEAGEVYVPGGYVEREMRVVNRPTMPVKPWLFLPRQLDAFRDVVAMLRAKGIPYVLVQAPYSSLLYRSRSNNGEINEYFRSLGTYYNFNELLPVSDSLCYDEDHLNQAGVRYFNAEFLRVLRK